MIDFSMLENKHLACQIVPVEISKRSRRLPPRYRLSPRGRCPHFDREAGAPTLQDGHEGRGQGRDQADKAPVNLCNVSRPIKITFHY